MTARFCSRLKKIELLQLVHSTGHPAHAWLNLLQSIKSLSIPNHSFTHRYGVRLFVENLWLTLDDKATQANRLFCWASITHDRYNVYDAIIYIIRCHFWHRQPSPVFRVLRSRIIRNINKTNHRIESVFVRILKTIQRKIRNEFNRSVSSVDWCAICINFGEIIGWMAVQFHSDIHMYT